MIQLYVQNPVVLRKQLFDWRIGMYNERNNRSQLSYCDFVPGYEFYNIVGNGLAEDLINIFERLYDFMASIRR